MVVTVCLSLFAASFVLPIYSASHVWLLRKTSFQTSLAIPSFSNQPVLGLLDHGVRTFALLFASFTLYAMYSSHL